MSRSRILTTTNQFESLTKIIGRDIFMKAINFRSDSDVFRLTFYDLDLPLPSHPTNIRNFLQIYARFRWKKCGLKKLTRIISSLSFLSWLHIKNIPQKNLILEFLSLTNFHNSNKFRDLINLNRLSFESNQKESIESLLLANFLNLDSTLSIIF